MMAAAPPLAEIELWTLATGVDVAADESADTARAAALLDDAEHARIAALHFARDRDRYVARRALLRLVLAAHRGIDPADLRLHAGRGEKPRLLGADPAPDFNASNTPGRAAIAVSRTPGRRLGVDIERVRPLPDFDLVAPTVFTAREMDRWWAGSADDSAARSELFFRIWTRKEALLKAEGFGLAIAPRTVDVPLDPLPSGRVIAAERRVPGSRSSWWLSDARPAPDIALSLAVARRDGDPAELQARDTPAPVPASIAAVLPAARLVIRRLVPLTPPDTRR
jgi:4'-phosphopantetheinyl transferase